MSSWDNRVDFVVRHMYDIDNNGVLDANDFTCMAIRACLIEGKGDVDPARMAHYIKLMAEMWKEISDIADDDKDGKISNDEFKEAVRKTCVGKKFDDFPQSMKAFTEACFYMMDIDNDGVVGLKEFRYNVIQRIAIEEVAPIDKAFDSLLNDEDRKRGGINMARFKELYGQFLGNIADNHQGIYLFGPL